MIAGPEVVDAILAKATPMAGKQSLGFGHADTLLALQAVYFASIRREEGEVVRPHLALLSDDTLAALAMRAALMLSSDPKPATPELLRKRSLAFDRRSTSFLATPSDAGLVLRGVAHWQSRGDLDDRRGTGLPIVRFDAEDAGTVSIYYDRNRLGLLRDGNFFPVRSPVFSSPAFKRALLGSFSRLSVSDSRGYAFMASLEYLVRSAMSHGLGATIVVIDEFVPVELADFLEAGEPVTYRLRKTEGGTPPAAVRDEVMDPESKQASLTQLLPGRRGYLDFVARLACVDGALILGPRLNPIRFAAKLRAPACTEPVYLGGDQDHAIDSVLQGVGTRHSSALNFVSHIKKVVAFTISSDGPVSAFGWLDSRLSWWKNAVDL